MTDSNIPQSTATVKPFNLHSFCPDLARQYGEYTAALLQGLSYKIAKSSKIKDGKQWHFDTLEALVERWPYLSQKGIAKALSAQVATGNVFKGNYNTMRIDRTCWYSVTEALKKNALSKSGKVSFDVDVATKTRSIVAGTLYHNLRFNLLCMLGDTPDFEGVPYHTVCKSALTKHLPFSLSTIKRGYKTLIKHRLISRNPATGAYTLVDSDALIVPPSMIRTGSKVEMGANASGSKVEMPGSFGEMPRSNVEMPGSKVETNNPLVTPFTNTVHKHHTPSASPDVVGVCSNSSCDTKQSSPDKSTSAPVPGKETDLAELQQMIDCLITQTTKADFSFARDTAHDLANVFITDGMSTCDRFTCWKSTSHQQVAATVGESLKQFINEQNFAPELIELIHLLALEAVSCVFSHSGKTGARNDKFHADTVALADVLWDFINNLYADDTLTADEKAELAADLINYHNKQGWQSFSGEALSRKVAITSATYDKLVGHFENNPDKSAQHLVDLLADCLDVAESTTAPATGFDKLFNARRAGSLPFLFVHLEKVEAELAA